MTTRGFTLLEVMVAAALLSVVTAGAMAAFLAQSRATNTQNQTITANDSAREAIRLIGNDARSAAAGTTVGSGGFSACDQGTVPFDSAGAQIACLPPAFRSNTPLILPSTALGNPTTFTATNCGGTDHPGYQLNYNGTYVPSAADFFCPDDLVLLAVDDANPLFMVQNSPGISSAGNVTPIEFAGTLAGTAATTRLPTGSPPGAGYGFDDSTPTSYLTPAGGCALAAPYCEPMLLIGGASGAVLLNAISPNAGAAWAAASPSCSLPSCLAEAYPVIPSTPAAGIDFFRNNLSFGAVAMPARLTRYSIEPVDVNGIPVTCTAGATNPCVSANLVRSQIVPLTGPASIANTKLSFATISSTVLLQGVVDMQVEFGLANSTGLVYVNSGGLQSQVWTTPSTPHSQVGAAAQSADNCSGGTIDPGVWSGVCFPTGGPSGMNAIAALRTVRLNLTVRSGGDISTRQSTASQSSAAVGAIYNLQPSVQDIAPNGNVEAQQWGFNTGATFVGVQPLDGANYRQVSTEIYIRNLGWNNNL